MAATAALVAGPACGPVESLVVIGDGAVALEAARVSDADKHAPFEYRAAEEYLHKAREEMNFSEYEASIALAEIALKYAEGARMRALDRGQRAKPIVLPPPRPAVAPPPRPKARGGTGTGAP